MTGCTAINEQAHEFFFEMKDEFIAKPRDQGLSGN